MRHMLDPSHARAEIARLGVRHKIIASALKISPSLLSLWLSGRRPAPPGRLEAAVGEAYRIAGGRGGRP